MNAVRPSFIALLSALALSAAPLPGAPLAWPDLLNRPHPKPSATLAYGPHRVQVVDVWIPRGRGPFPTVLMVHGGCWQTAIADRHIMDWASEDLRRRGIAVWNIDYRGVDRPGGGYPGTFRDVSAAADGLTSHAHRYRLNPRQIVAVGHSAGAHLALWLAARPRLPASSPLRTRYALPIAAVVSLGGLPDLEEETRIANGCGTEVSATLGQGHYAETSVPRLAPLGVRQVLVNGLEDKIIPTTLATSYRRRMRAAGDHVEVRWVADAGHVDLIAPGSKAWAIAVTQIQAALRR